MTSKHELLIFLLNAIYSDVFKKQVEILENINSKQAALVPESTNGFWYRAEQFCSKSQAVNRTKSLHQSLYPEINEYLKQYNETKTEETYVRSYLVMVLNSLKLNQVHHLIPSSLHSVLKNRGITFNETPPENTELILKYNQKGYDLLLKRLLLNTVGY